MSIASDGRDFPGTGRGPNVVTIVLDCARAKSFVSAPGARAARTPVLDRLASHGTRFPRAVAPSNWTVPSHYSILTGLYPCAHGVRTYRKLAHPPTTTAGFLRARGYQTSLFSENRLLAGFGLEDSFETSVIGVDGGAKPGAVVNGPLGRIERISPADLVTLFRRVPPLLGPLALAHRRQEVAYKREASSDRILAGYDRWLQRRDPSRPFYSFFNFVDTHDPYEIQPLRRLSWMERVDLYTPRFYLLAIPEIQQRVDWDLLVEGYIRSIESVDAKVGRLLEVLQRSGELSDTLIIVTADHGQSFGEGGHVYHGTGATDSVIRVPLIVAPPEGARVPTEVRRWVSLCEIDAWVRSSVVRGYPYDSGGRAPDEFLSPMLREPVVYGEGAPASDLIRSVRSLRSVGSWNHRLIAAFRGDEKLVLDLDTGSISRWDATRDADYETPELIPPAEIARVRAEVFGPYERSDGSKGEGPESSADSEPVTIDERLRSWGYD